MIQQASLALRRIFLVEDEYLLGYDLRHELEQCGATVIGPVGTLDSALTCAKSGECIDGGVLDVNLRGEMSFPIADLLAEEGVPFVFATGYGAESIPERFAHVLCFNKPVRTTDVAAALATLLQGKAR